jgi:hypothetical protein
MLCSATTSHLHASKHMSHEEALEQRRIAAAVSNAAEHKRTHGPGQDGAGRTSETFRRCFQVFDVCKSHVGLQEVGAAPAYSSWLHAC